MMVSAASLEELTDQLETWLAAHRIHPNQQTPKILRENLQAVESTGLGPLIVEVQARLALLSEKELRVVLWELRNPLRSWDRLVH